MSPALHVNKQDRLLVIKILLTFKIQRLSHSFIVIRPQFHNRVCAVVSYFLSSL